MSKKEEIVSADEMSLMHEDLLRSAEARARLPSVNFDRISKLAAEAYRTGSRGAEAAEPGTAYAEIAAIATRQMKQRAAMDVGRLIEIGMGSTDTPRRGWVTDLLAGFVVPAAFVVLVSKLQSDFGNDAGWWALALSGLVFVVLALAAARQIFRSRSPLGAARFMEGGPTFRTFSWQSGGSIAAGLFVLLVGGWFAMRETNQQSVQKLEASIRQLNKAVAWAIAARQAGADRETTSRVVANATDIQWNAALSWPTQSGMLLASAELPGHAVYAEVRLSEDPSRARDSVLAAAVRLRNGDTKYTDYLVGKVIAADLNTVTVMPSSGVKHAIDLPKGEPAPPLQSVVVMALRKGKNEATYIQVIDTAVADLKAK